MTDSGLEGSFEYFDYPVNLVTNTNQLSENIGSIAERYCQDHIAIHLHAWIGASRGNVEFRPFCAFLQHVNEKNVGVHDKTVMGSRVVVPHALNHQKSALKSPVFVCIGETLKGTKGMPFNDVSEQKFRDDFRGESGKGVVWREVASIVRLQPLDVCLVGQTEVGNPVAPEVCGFRCDGELGVPVGVAIP